MITIYGRTTSFNVQKVMWLVEELNLQYDHIEVGGKFGGLDDPSFAAINPLRKIPVLVDDENIIWESHTILRYLIAQYGSGIWFPENHYKRSLYERWMDWSQTFFQPAFMGVFWEYYRKPVEKRDMEVVNNNLSKCLECLKIISQPLSQASFLVGDMLTLADITVGAIIYRLTEQGLNVPLPRPVETWYRRLKQRPGYQKWVMSDFEELKGRETF